MVHIKARSNVFPCHNLLRCIFEDDKFIHHSVYIIHAKLILTGFEIANILFAWTNIFRHKKWKRKVQPKANFEKETMTRDWI